MKLFSGFPGTSFFHFLGGRGREGNASLGSFTNLSFFLQVVVPLYYAAYRYSAPRLLANCCHFMLVNYKDVSDPGESVPLSIM